MLSLFFATSFSFPQVGECKQFYPFSPGEVDLVPGQPLCLIGDIYHSYYIKSSKPVKVIGANNITGEVFAEKENAFIFTSERNINYTINGGYLYNCSLFALTTKEAQKIRIYSSFIAHYDNIAFDSRVRTHYKTYVVLKNKFSVKVTAIREVEGSGQYVKWQHIFVPSVTIFNPNFVNCELDYLNTSTFQFNNDSPRDHLDTVRGDAMNLKIQSYEEDIATLGIVGKAESTEIPVEDVIFEIRNGMVYSHDDDNEKLYPCEGHLVDYVPTPKPTPMPTETPKPTPMPTATPKPTPKPTPARTAEPEYTLNPNEGGDDSSESATTGTTAKKSTAGRVVVGILAFLAVVAIVAFCVFWFVIRKQDENTGSTIEEQILV